MSLAALGRSVCGPVTAKHTIKRVGRLLGNRLLHQEVAKIYGAMARGILQPHNRSILLVERTNLDVGQWALVAAVPLNGRSIPLYSEVHPERSLGPAAVHRAFLRVLHREVSPPTCTLIVVADTGFNRLAVVEASA